VSSLSDIEFDQIELDLSLLFSLPTVWPCIILAFGLITGHT